MKQNEQIYTCDVCGKKETDKGEKRICLLGGNPFAGWLSVKRNIDPAFPAIRELSSQEWDICGPDCLMKLGVLLSRSQPPDTSPLGRLKKVLLEALEKKKA